MGSVRKALFTAVSLLGLMVLTACGGKVVVTADSIDMPTPLVERLPITIGVHYEELRNHHHLERWFRSGPEYEYRLGPPSVAMFNRLFADMFKSVLPVKSPSTTTIDGQKISAVLSLNIDSLQMKITRQKYTGVTYFITYSMTLYAPPGTKKTTIKAAGLGAAEEILETQHSIFVARAIPRAAAALVARFYEDPIIRNWLKDQGVDINTKSSGEVSSK